ncbi:Uncharacterized protein TPAR_08519 [Tolypocladium paradoxum]|uniref:Uncharacterized protein n=1 Tax=Tolypocladium paradoxum TaxID=94208 RepID=A0A2S4KM59_9HYPO|nr:Uncharacterized protein TPAR_08519 [Tolypocladium paradoxum]
MATLSPAAGTHLQPPGASAASAPAPARPTFNSHLTSDRLREGAGLYLPPLFRASSNIPKGRTSVFKETGLDDPLGCLSPAPAVDQKYPAARP